MVTKINSFHQIYKNFILNLKHVKKKDYQTETKLHMLRDKKLPKAWKLYTSMLVAPENFFMSAPALAGL